MNCPLLCRPDTAHSSAFVTALVPYTVPRGALKHNYLGTRDSSRRRSGKPQKAA